MSHLLPLLLLYRAGFIVGRYISIEMLIEKSKDSYYEVLQESPRIETRMGINIFRSRIICWACPESASPPSAPWLIRLSLGILAKW
jgi:hypothetical protein